MNQLRIQLNYGTIAGLLTFAAFALFSLAGLNPLGEVKYLSLAFPVVFIILGIRKIRDTELNGYITYRQSLSIGWFISLIYASLYAMMVYLFGLFVTDSFFHLHMTESIAALEALREWVDAETVNKWISEAREMTLSALAFGDFNGKMMAGMAISLIIAAILRKPVPAQTPQAVE